MPSLPNGNRAEVDRQKIIGYALDATHGLGRHKARVFRSVLGIGPENADVLVQALEESARNADAALERTDAYGAHYSVEFVLLYDGRSAVLRSLWVVRAGEDFPRLVSVFVK